LSLIDFIGSPVVADGRITNIRAISAGFGPWIVTPDELESLGPFRLTVSVNETDREYTLAGVAELVSQISATETLLPGDTIALLAGWPAVPSALQPGDRLAVAVTGIGVLENTIEDETVRA
jgi:2-keto-4-pentenoate hydratase/2-oxohepta-3-ene-1,7-dioic acid hydratase in catechol pathway